ncbi:alpha/beta hydrolase fold domain-containing protein [Dyadobacter arcticus]|uniref:Acetyl esterase/lipase n=1 Tax=Dyadobacter arcticus TaxID=1078754 RepID=A0ABX0UKU7_9BACT|nr:alpha/beta hydrolase fold domain-containing protein [Dyadobacter arcticus]NIJ52629.1 acetyl esterase/lipase [Dyadobacter arcticus]
MKNKTRSLTIFLPIFWLSIQPMLAQTCNSGKLDSTVAAFLKRFPADDRTPEELRKTINFEYERKGGPPATPYPQTDVECLKITADSIPILVFNPLHVIFAIETYATKQDYHKTELSPVRSKDLANLPPAVILTAEFDPLRDQGAAYADSLRKSKVKVWYACYPGQIHVFIGASGEINSAITTLIRHAMEEQLVRN